jgi:glycosyltransferase involved in cell wall biosynthesis
MSTLPPNGSRLPGSSPVPKSLLSHGRRSLPASSLSSGAPAKARRALEDRARSLPIVAICHLSWEWVWQRPQQFLSRLARTHPLLFVETHCSQTPFPIVKMRAAEGPCDVTILEMHLPAHRWDDGHFIDMQRRRVLKQVLARDCGAKFAGAILWINDPMAVISYAGQLDESMIVYDCMDELSQFDGAPPMMVERERVLTEVADVIFCGGRKMRDKRLAFNGNTHFYGTGVDCQHFGAAMDLALPVHPDIADLPGPVLGYFGVIDERIDYALLASLADAEPSWSIAMVGPFAKVDPQALPQRANLHWLGGKSYAELPALTKGMDVCMMPFALNAATEFINPTKALEYMAAGKPVVATGLDEVKANFATASKIAGSHAEFIDHCRRQVATPSAAMIRRGLKLAADNTWEAIVAKMDGHILDVFSAHRAAEADSARMQNRRNNPYV